jgi:uncharacterized protein (DUF608 family)
MATTAPKVKLFQFIRGGMKWHATNTGWKTDCGRFSVWDMTDYRISIMKCSLKTKWKLSGPGVKELWPTMMQAIRAAEDYRGRE